MEFATASIEAGGLFYAPLCGEVSFVTRCFASILGPKPKGTVTYTFLNQSLIALRMRDAGRENNMTRVIAILFVLGFIWAALLWVPVLAMFDDPLKYCRISLPALVGFWVWFGWGWHCLTGGFPLVSPRTFWTISLITHLVWLAILWGSPLSFGLIWIVTNVIVAFVALLPEAGKKGWKCRLASIAAYGLPIALGAELVATSHVANRETFSGVTAWLVIVAAIALLLAAWRKPYQSIE